MTESYKTLSGPCGPVLFRERKSKFLGYAFPVLSGEGAREHLSALWQRYPDATHICYAYRIGHRQPETRMNDDGEPAYSAGAPIFGQLESFDLYDVLVCVVRYYGGTKLGVGGLIQAYRETARMCLEEAPVIVREPVRVLHLEFGYDSLDAVMRTLSQHQLSPQSQQMELRCAIQLQVAEHRAEAVMGLFRALAGVRATWAEPGAN